MSSFSRRGTRTFVNFKFQKVKMLVTQDIKEIALLPQEEAKESMGFKLGLGHLGDDDDPIKVIFVDFLYGCLEFTMSRGFPWRKIGHAVEFAYHFLKGICVEHHRITDALLTMKRNAKHIESLTDRQKTLYLDFITDTVLQHYNLYKAVFCKPRQEMVGRLPKLVETPPTPLPLSIGTELDAHYMYSQEIAPLEAAERRAHDRVLRARAAMGRGVWGEELGREAGRMHLGMTKELAEETSKELVEIIMNSQKKGFENVIEAMTEEMEAKLAIRAVPQPDRRKSQSSHSGHQRKKTNK